MDDLQMSKRRSTKMVESLTDLPPNILLEILVRLPLRTLYASKLVCKTFLNLTSPNPHFNDLHSSHAAQTLLFQFGDVFKPSRLLRLLDPEIGRYVELRAIFQVPKVGKSNVVFHRSNFRDENKYVLVNSCNGLIYLARRDAHDERTLVCNPITNEYVVIPDVGKESRLNSPTKGMWFGFSQGTNQYKVLRIFGSINREPVEMGAQVIVVGTNTWRDIRYTPLGSDLSWDTCSTSLNGVIYWLDDSRNDMVCFDFEREMFGEIALPPEFGEEHLRNKHCMSIGVLGGCLSLSYNDFTAHHVDIWVLKKAGNQESWRKEFIVDTVMPMGRPVCGQFKPLQILRNGEILMRWISNDLVSYDPRNKKLKLYWLKRLKLSLVAVAFTPSFNSLKDTLLVDKVIVQHMRPRHNEVDL